MKQVLFIGAGSRFPKGLLAFLSGMQQEDRICAKGLFFKPADYASLAVLGDMNTPVLELEEREIRTKIGRAHV